MEGAYSRLGGAEEGRVHEVLREERQVAARRRRWLVAALLLVAMCAAGAAVLGAASGGRGLQVLVQFLEDDHPPQPGSQGDFYEPERCIPRRVPVPSVDDMTLEEKIGQMTQVDQLAVGNGSDIINYFIGSTLSGGGGAPSWGNEAHHWAALVDNMAAKAYRTRLAIPMLYGVDAVHGHNNVHGATIFPHHVGLGAARDPALVRDVGAAAAREVVATGIRWAFAPTLAVCRDPRWGRCYESFSEQTAVVQALSSEIDGWQTKPTDPSDPAAAVPGSLLTAATAKHFVGDGGTAGGKDEGDTIASEAELRAVHLPPFRSAVDRGVTTVMISYSSWNGLKMHANRYLISDVLKGELGFKGVVVSDWAAIQQIPGNWSYQVRTSINAGLDIIMVPTDYKAFFYTLREEVLAGRVPMSRINDAVRRVLDLKARLGLFENACAPRALLPLIGAPAHRQVARRAVRASLTLLKNAPRRSPLIPGAAAGPNGAGSMFPLPLAGARILVAGTHADDVGLQCGGWTIKWQGGYGNITAGTTVLQGVRAAAAAGGAAAVLHATHPTGREEADYGIVVVGETPYTEYYGDDQRLEMSDASTEAVLRVCESMPCVVVFMSGRVININPVLPAADAFVAAWLPGSEAGGGIADALFSPDFEYSGRLPFTWYPHPAGSSAGNHLAGGGGRSEDEQPLFPFGFGLDSRGLPLPAVNL